MPVSSAQLKKPLKSDLGSDVKPNEEIIPIKEKQMDASTNWIEMVTTASAAVTAISTTVLTGVTFVYVWLTRKLLKATQESRAPVLSVDVRPESIEKWAVVIRNNGMTAAHSLTFSVKGSPILKGLTFSSVDINYEKQRWPKWEELDFVKNGITCIGPGQTVADSIEIPGQTDFTGVLEFSCSFKDDLGNTRQVNLTYDFKVFWSRRFAPKEQR